jgi:hypothetical protein
MTRGLFEYSTVVEGMDILRLDAYLLVRCLEQDIM